MNVKNRLITIRKKDKQIQTDTVGAQLASFKKINSSGVEIEFMNQGLLDPEHSAYGKTAPNLVMTPGPAARFDKKTLAPAKNYKGEDMPVIRGKVYGRTVDAVALKYNNFPTLATQHGWAQYNDYKLQGGGKRGDDYYILVNGPDEMSPFEYRHHVACSIEDDGSIKYITELTNTGKGPIPGGLGWHPVFKLHDDTRRYYVVFEDVVPADDTCEVYDGFEVDCTEIIETGSAKFKGLKSATVAIYYETEDGQDVPYLKVSAECPVWVLWGKGNGFAIEPWNTDKTKAFEHITNQNDVSFLSDKGYVVLEPGESTSIEATIRVFDEYVNYKQIENIIQEQEPRKKVLSLDLTI